MEKKGVLNGWKDHFLEVPALPDPMVHMPSLCIHTQELSRHISHSQIYSQHEAEVK